MSVDLSPREDVVWLHLATGQKVQVRVRLSVDAELQRMIIQGPTHYWDDFDTWCPVHPLAWSARQGGPRDTPANHFFHALDNALRSLNYIE